MDKIRGSRKGPRKLRLYLGKFNSGNLPRTKKPTLAKKAITEEKMVIFSKSLNSDKVEKLGNKNIFLKRQEGVQKAAEENKIN